MLIHLKKNTIQLKHQIFIAMQPGGMENSFGVKSFFMENIVFFFI